MRVLMLVENLSVPFDRRVWQEARALTTAGHEVDVICPMGPTYDREPFVELDGIRIHRYPLVEARAGLVGYAREYATALGQTIRVARRLARDQPFDAVHACNPPDLFFLVARWLRRRDGTRFIFDHHDLVPELQQSRPGPGGPLTSGLIERLLLLLEHWTLRSADVVLSTNESYRDVAINRGGVDPTLVTVVRNAPDPSRFAGARDRPELRRGRDHLVCYVGVMGPQDGVDHAVRAVHHLRTELGRDDTHTVFIGDGPMLDDCVELTSRLGLDDMVEFTGRIPDALLADYLASADVGLMPDPRTPLNEVSSMNKVVEYLAMGLPVVAFDLRETRVTAGSAGWFAPTDDDHDLARGIDLLLDAPERRRAMGDEGRRRVADELSWEVATANLLAAYTLVGADVPIERAVAA